MIGVKYLRLASAQPLRRSASSLGVMDSHKRSASTDRKLARFAGAFLGSSILLVPALVFLGLSASEPKRAFANFPAPLLMLLVAVAAFIVSATALTRLERSALADRRRLWRISLLSNLVIVAMIILGFGLKAGAVLSIMEILAISIHVAALTLPVRFRNDF